MNGGKDIAIFSISVANHLVSEGFELRAISRNHTNPKLPVFYFVDGELIRRFLLDKYNINIR